MSKKTVRKLIICGLCVILVGLSAGMAMADSSLLSPGTSRINAGDSFDFTLDLSSVIEKAEEESEGGLDEFVVTLNVKPAISALSVSEGVGSVNAVSGEYQVNSTKLGDHSKLHFTVTPAGEITNETTYTVSVSVTGSVNASDSFTFVVVPVKKEEPQTAPENATDMKDMNFKSGMKMPGKMKSGGGASFGGGSGSASTVYAGSWDNYLDSLSVEGFEFTRAFNKIRDTYFMTVPLATTELSVSAKASDSSAIVAITGNTDLPEGRSKIMINVTADDGSVRIYRIYVDRTDEQKEEKKSGKPDMPEGFERPEGMELPEGFELPEGMEKPEGMEMPEGFEPPEGMEMPEGFEFPGGQGKPGSFNGDNTEESNERDERKPEN